MSAQRPSWHIGLLLGTLGWAAVVWTALRIGWPLIQPIFKALGLPY